MKVKELLEPINQEQSKEILRAGEEENTDQDGTIWAMEEKERI